MNEQRLAKEWIELPMDLRPKVRYWVPGAAMDEEDLVQELKDLKARGFGGVEVVPLLGTPEEIIHGEDGWGTNHWNHMLSVIEQTVRAEGMSLDVANGPAWPISMPTVTDADDPAALKELTYGVISCGSGRYQGPLPRRRVQHDEGTPKLLHVFAYQRNPEGKLVTDSYQPIYFPADGLTANQDIGLTADLGTPAPGCEWLIFAFYVQPSTQKTGDGMYYVIDHISQAGVDACEAYWKPVFEACENLPAMESFFCDSLEYRVCLDWSTDFPAEFERRRGYSILPYLPFIGFRGTFPESDAPGYQLDHTEISDMVNRDYMETLTQCYCEYHLQGLEKMANRYGKTIRYQVAYNKPYEEECCPLYVSVPENEALGRCTLDGQKTMAAAAHLGRKKRYSFECAAEFGNCYGQSYEDLFWWVKRGLMSGMNAQVLHGTSYSGGYHGKYTKNGSMSHVSWPGYEAFGRFVSNNWGRTLSVEDARGCMDTIARLNGIFRRQVRVDCAIFRASYRNDGLIDEYGYFEDDGNLLQAGYSYETLSEALLSHPNCRVSEGLLDVDGAGWQCLLIPPQHSISGGMLQIVSRLLDAGFPVIWFGEMPVQGQFYQDWQTKELQEKWQQHLSALWNDERLVHADDIHDAAAVLGRIGVRPRAQFDAQPNLMTAVREDTAGRTSYYAFYGYNRVEYAPDDPCSYEFSVSAMYRKGTTRSSYERPGKGSRRQVRVSLASVGQVYQMNPWTAQERRVDFTECNGRMEGLISVEEDDLVILAVRTEEGLPATQQIPASQGSRPVRSAAQTVILPEAQDTVPLEAQDAWSEAGLAGQGVLDRAVLDSRDAMDEAASAAPADDIAAAQSAGQVTQVIPVSFDTLVLQEFGPRSEGEKSFLRSGFSQDKWKFEPVELVPWYSLEGVPEDFAGRGIYSGRLRLDEKKAGRRYILCLGDVCDTFSVRVNGKKTEFGDQVLKEVDITEELLSGENVLEVRVVSNLYNKLMNDLYAPRTNMKMPFAAKKYGIWESPGKECVLRIE